jgi:hypothetical protein
MIDGTPLLRWWARRRVAALNAMDAAATQEALLRGLLSQAVNTRFGRAHGFAAIRDVADFQARVPLRRYDDLWREYLSADFPVLRDVTWPGSVPYVALSSGTTTGTTKRIPVTRAMMAANRGAALDTLAWHMHAHPNSRPFAGKSFMLGGSTALEDLAPGVQAGDLSGIATRDMPRPLRTYAWPPEPIEFMPDWDGKLATLVQATPRAEIRVLTGTPSWLLMLLDRMNPAGVALPNLELLIHGGVAWGPYAPRMARHLPRGCATREVYPASEGFFAIADRGDGEGLRLTLDRGVFFEFVPVAELDRPSPTRHWVGTIETGVDYAIVVSTCAGLWAHVVGDVVRFLDRTPPRLLLTGRTAWTLSLFGEHLDGAEIVAALQAAGIAAEEWCCGPEFVGALGRHRFLVEGTAPLDAAQRLDAALIAENDDYAAHRKGGQLLPPAVVSLPRGAFQGWMRARGKLGGQHKVPRVIADPARFAEAAAHLSSHDGPQC